MFGLFRIPARLAARSCAVAALIALEACSGNTNPYTNFQPIHQATPTPKPTATPAATPTASSAPTTGPTPSAAPTATPTASAPTATPTASPAPTPTPVPTTAVIVLSPAAGAVGNNGGCPPAGPASYTFTATETGYTGVFTWTQQAGSAAQFSVAPASVANGGTFTVTDSNPTVATGLWSITVMDSFGNTATEMVRSVICLE